MLLLRFTAAIVVSLPSASLPSLFLQAFIHIHFMPKRRSEASSGARFSGGFIGLLQRLRASPSSVNKRRLTKTRTEHFPRIQYTTWAFNHRPLSSFHALIMTFLCPPSQENRLQFQGTRSPSIPTCPGPLMSNVSVWLLIHPGPVLEDISPMKTECNYSFTRVTVNS